MDQSQVSFRQLLEAAPDAIVVVDRGGRIVLVNSQTEYLFGYGREELIGETIELLVPHKLRPTHVHNRARYRNDPHRRPMGSGLELAGQRRDGSSFPVEISLSPVTTALGHVWTMAAVRDITRRERVEKALKTVVQELEAFTYSVSHDLRAPIRQIDGFSRLLEEQLGDALDGKARHYLARIQEGARSMGGLVDDLLNLAILGKQEVHPEQVRFDDIVAEVVAALQTEIDGRDVVWNVKPLPAAECDAGLMRVVFTNLLSNAVKYTRPRSTAVIVVEQVDYGGVPVVAVRDNGVGFDMEYADKLFGVFQRLHRAEEFEGSGVGLATVQRIVHKHGGEIWAEAKPDDGASFYFTLPDLEGASL